MKTENGKISVVVVTYNSSQMITGCLESLTKSSPSHLEIIVIDNASRDQEISRRIVEKFSNARFIPNQKNIGYGAAVNQGVRLASGEYVFFINPDVIIPEGTIEKLVAFMESHSGCGACAPYILMPEKPWWYQWIFLRLPINLATGRIAKRKDCYKAKFLLGCAVLVKRDFFLKLGGFDERFFLYYEDDDFCRRIRDYGKSNYVVLSVSVIHFYGKSSATIPIREKGKILTKSRWYFAEKHNLWALKLWCKIYSPIQKFLCWLINRP